MGYRHYDRISQDKLQFPFGFGLSYSTFSYSDLVVSAVSNNTAEYPTVESTIPQGGHAELWDVLYNVTVSIANSVISLHLAQRVRAEHQHGG